MADKLSTPQDFCDKILSEIRDSNLHFLIQESPFSIYLTLRKKFTQKPATNSSPKTHEPNINAVPRENEIVDKDALTEELAKCKETLTVYESKLEQSEDQFMKEANKFKIKRDELADEIKLLKESLKRAHAEESNQKKSLADMNKLVKLKDKENYNLQQRLDNSLETTKRFKENLSELKKDKSTSEKSLRTLEKKTNATKEKLDEKIKTLEQSLLLKTVSLSPTLSTDMLNNEKPSSLSPFSNKLSSVTPDPGTRIPQTKSSTENITASSIDHSCSLETIASLDPTNNSSLGTTNNSSLDPTNKSNPDPTSSSLAHTASKNTSSSNEVTED